MYFFMTHDLNYYIVILNEIVHTLSSHDLMLYYRYAFQICTVFGIKESSHDIDVTSIYCVGIMGNVGNIC